MIGNDIISLAEVLPNHQALRPGFRDKVCLPEELHPLTTLFSEEISIWILWAAKESAYKVYRQAGGPAIFAPKKKLFQANSLTKSKIKGITKTPSGNYSTCIQVQADYIIAESWSIDMNDYRLLHRVIPLAGKEYQEQSAGLKREIPGWVAKLYGLSTESVSLYKNQAGVPYLSYQGQRMEVSISLSHHGYYGLGSILAHKNSPFLG